MKCDKVKRLIYEHAIGELSSEESGAIVSHLESCKECQGERQKLLKILAIASKKSSPQLDPGFWDRFDRELDEKLPGTSEEIEVKPIKVRAPLFKPIFAMATAVSVLLIAGILLFGNRGLTPNKVSVMSNEQLITEIEELEELAGGFVFYDNEELALDEFYLLEEMG